jgi:hypothetical protein
VLALDAARTDLAYLLVIPAYALAFRAHMQIEWARLRAMSGALAVKRSKASAIRSSEGS